ncbi:hypothetical protein [Alteromonas sp. a30]|uniref:hypothetical protein n=1 Tax=Alteromonas sp. a30 TaxID=2730917 RepID=UPI00227E4251|nr:hypothetical protein [Alteromonas sp. a30]MCY7294666.1 hypothetical protein [Alteromonas sp. a30]
MNAVITQLKDNLQLLYRKSIDADNALKQLRAQGIGKFEQVFEKQSGFESTSKEFRPYVEEVAKNIEALLTQDETQMQQSLPIIIKKMELLFKTLAGFQQSLKD